MNGARELIRPSPKGGRKGGLPDQVRAITLDDVQARWRRYYKPRNAILVLAGAVDEGTARQAVTAHFARLAPGEEIPRPGEPGKPKTGAVTALTVKSLQPQAEPVACLAYAAPQPGSAPYCAIPRDGGQALRGLGPVRRGTRPGHGLLPLARGSGRTGRERTGEAR